MALCVSIFITNTCLLEEGQEKLTPGPLMCDLNPGLFPLKCFLQPGSAVLPYFMAFIHLLPPQC